MLAEEETDIPPCGTSPEGEKKKGNKISLPAKRSRIRSSNREDRILRRIIVQYRIRQQGRSLHRMRQIPSQFPSFDLYNHNVSHNQYYELLTP